MQDLRKTMVPTPSPSLCPARLSPLFHPAELLAPAVEGVPRHPLPEDDLLGPQSGFRFFQDADDLFLRVAILAHCGALPFPGFAPLAMDRLHGFTPFRESNSFLSVGIEPSFQCFLSLGMAPVA